MSAVDQPHPERAAVRAAEIGASHIFSTEANFSTNLTKLSDPTLPNKPNHNQYLIRGDAVVTEEEMTAAKANQIANGVDYFKIDTHSEIPEDLRLSFGLSKLKIFTMLLQKERVADWKLNSEVVIKECKEADIEEDIVQIELDNYGHFGVEAATTKMRRMLQVAKESKVFNYYAAYIDGEMAAACHVFLANGYAGLDCLIVNPKFRGKYIATTMIAHIAKLFDGKVYLHAAEPNTATQMYLKMGFDIIDTSFEHIVRGILPQVEPTPQ